LLDITRAKLEHHIANASTPEEKELAQALLYGYDLGELKVLTDTATGGLLFAVALPN
jgi:hypothetical protein